MVAVMMKVWINGEERSLPEGTSVQKWMELDQVRSPEVAIIHVNDRDVPPERRETTLLRTGDRIQLLYFLGDS